MKNPPNSTKRQLMNALAIRKKPATWKTVTVIIAAIAFLTPVFIICYRLGPR